MNGSGHAATPGSSSARVVRVEEQHFPALAGFYRKVWDRSATSETVGRARASAAADNPITRGEAPPIFLFMMGSDAVGHLSTIPVRLWTDHGEREAHWLQGLWVLPQHRNGPIGFLLVREALQQLGIALSVVVESAPRRLFAAQGFTDLGRVPNHLRLLKPARVLGRVDIERTGLLNLPGWVHGGLRMAQKSGLTALAGAGVAGATRLWTAAVDRSDGTLVVDASDASTTEIDDLWRQVRGGLAAAPVRDGMYMASRYELGESSPYRMLSARVAGSLVGLIVVRLAGASSDPRLSGLRVAVISDVLCLPGQTGYGSALLESAERLARDGGADVLLCTASHSALVPVLRSRAFIPLPGNQHFMVRDPEGAHELPQQLEQWWLTRGDSRGDAPF